MTAPNDLEITLRRLANAAPNQFVDFVYALQTYVNRQAQVYIHASRENLENEQGKIQMLYSLLLAFEACLKPTGVVPNGPTHERSYPETAAPAGNA